MKIWDVVVVGAGPAGCTAATLLAREGLRVVLVDKSAAPPPKVCGEYLSPGCLSILDGLGALKSLKDAGAPPLSGMIIHTGAGSTLRATYPCGVPPDGSPTHALAVRRDWLDPLLLDVAVKNGAEFEPGFQVSDLIWEDGCVAGVQGRRRGQPTALRGRLVIGADGRNSVVARRLGAVERHRRLDKMALVGYVTGARRADDVGEIFLGKDRYAILNPITPDLTNVGLIINRRDFERPTQPRDILLETASTLPNLGDRLSSARLIGPTRCLGPLAYRATRLTAPGALLIGDAAGFLDPFTGEGIYAGLRSAELAVHAALPLFLTGSTVPRELRAYDQAWRREFLPKWRLCAGLQHAIRHRALAEWIISRLIRRPDLTTLLMAAIGDLTRARGLNLRLLLRLLAPWNGNA